MGNITRMDVNMIENIIKALSLECLKRGAILNTPQNVELIQFINELDQEFETGDIDTLARVYDVALGLVTI